MTLMKRTNSKLRISGMFELTRPVYFINDPKIAKIIAIKDFDHFVDRRTLVDENVDKLFGKSILNMKGERWRGEYKY